MMRIGIDARALEEVEPTGVARYVRGILREWDAALPNGVEVWCYTRRCVADAARFQHFHWRTVTGGVLAQRGLIWQNTVLPWLARQDRIDVIWAPFNLGPLTATIPVVATIYDVSFAANPRWFGLHERLLWPLIARLTVWRAARVVTISEFSKREIVAHLGVAATSIAVALPAAAPSLRPADPAAVVDLRARLELDKPYVLYVGALFSRRNVLPLLDAWQRVCQDHPDWQLVLVGPNRHHPPLDVGEAARDRSIDERVRYLAYVDEAELPLLYTGALAFIYPSSYEGFGLPVLEAMICGAPVITGNRTSLPEVAGDAAILVEPSSSRQLAAALDLVGTQDRLRAELRRRGARRAADFSWSQTASETMRVLMDVARRRAEPGGAER